ncbi:unnamed protein product [Pieris macdunnoughi]|uniref:CCHC-type domain-containing protein n=1 Tax=Pieris macdunnoughi TaxID=345717 RepID=A0A821XF41_9NEOP|nr:unnamed protein product [Pieris macdunnoughi]
MIKELQAVSFLKRKPNVAEEPDTKQFKSSTAGTSTAIQCFNCGKMGHKSMRCKLKRIPSTSRDVRNPATSSTHTVPMLQLQRCWTLCEELSKAEQRGFERRSHWRTCCEGGSVRSCSTPRKKKLDSKYKGPFKVSEVIDGDRYLIKALDSKRTFKYAHDHLRGMSEVLDGGTGVMLDGGILVGMLEGGVPRCGGWLVLDRGTLPWRLVTPVCVEIKQGVDSVDFD